MLWANGSKLDLGTLRGPNSGVFWPVKNNRGLIAGIAETPDANPLGEKWSCSAFPSVTGNICLGFVWQNGVMTPLPTLGGYNGYATGANNIGQVVGWAENTVHDPTCTGRGQVLQFRAVIWGPQNGQIQELPPLPGDTVSAATAINDKGQVVGISGICDQAVGRRSAIHAVLWENGIPIDLGNIGGDAWNTPTAINNHGTIVGFANQSPGTAGSFEAFIWTKEGGMKPLGAIGDDPLSLAFGINDKNQVVGLSIGGPYGSRAFSWDGVMTDLNTLTVPGSAYLLYANDINDRAEIVGEAFDPNTNEAPGYVAIPSPAGAQVSAAPRVGGNASGKLELPEKVRQQLRQRFGRALQD
jgi:probable HAF family extracellular repeat protein